MLPDNTFSSISVSDVLLSPDDRTTSALLDYERGGVALLDASEGLLGYTWRCFTAGSDVLVQRDGQAPIVLFQATDITELSFTFDQNMHYCIAYIQQGVMRMRWFDSAVNGFVVSDFGAAINPRLTLDDKRSEAAQTSDIILAYLKDTRLCYRQQRDRFLIEYTLRGGLFPGTRLGNVGMTKALRLQFELL